MKLSFHFRVFGQNGIQILGDLQGAAGMKRSRKFSSSGDRRTSKERKVTLQLIPSSTDLKTALRELGANPYVQYVLLAAAACFSLFCFFSFFFSLPPSLLVEARWAGFVACLVSGTVKMVWRATRLFCTAICRLAPFWFFSLFFLFLFSSLARLRGEFVFRKIASY